MKRGRAKDFLERVVLDDSFRELAIADPWRAFEGFDLSEEEQAILASRDDRILGLLGRAVGHGRAHTGKLSTKQAIDPTAPPPQSLPEIKLLLHMVPRTQQSPGSGPGVSYEASLHPWPDEGAGGAEPGPNASAANQADSGSGRVSWMIRIIPTIVGAQEAGLEVAYSASIVPLADQSGQSRSSNDETTKRPANSPWNHPVDSAAAKSAAQAVTAAGAEQRFDKLLELIHALQTGDDVH